NSSNGVTYTGLSNGTGFNYKFVFVSPQFTQVKLADFNGDGKTDVLLYNRNTGAAYLGISDGTGDFNFSPIVVPAGFDTLQTGDLNVDGKADVLFYNSATGAAQIGLS